MDIGLTTTIKLKCSNYVVIMLACLSQKAVSLRSLNAFNIQSRSVAIRKLLTLNNVPSNESNFSSLYGSFTWLSKKSFNAPGTQSVPTTSYPRSYALYKISTCICWNRALNAQWCNRSKDSGLRKILSRHYALCQEVFTTFVITTTFVMK